MPPTWRNCFLEEEKEEMKKESSKMFFRCKSRKSKRIPQQLLQQALERQRQTNEKDATEAERYRHALDQPNGLGCFIRLNGASPAS
jgi:hypothetical protein